MRRTGKIAFLSVGILGLLLGIFWFLSHQAQPPLSNQSNSKSNPARTKQPEGPTAGAPLVLPAAGNATGTKSGSTSALVQTLTDAPSDNWLAAATDLQALSSKDQWRVLEVPGVADQPYAKLLRHKMAMACGSTLRFLEIDARKGDFDKSEAVIDWCKNLSKVGTPRQIFDNSKADVNNPEWWVAPLKADELSDEEKAVYTGALLDRLDDAKSIVEIRNVFEALWLQHSSLFARSWPEVARLSRYDRGLLNESVTIAAACIIAGGCGPGSVHTISYCALIPGFQCLDGMSLDDAMRWNLSPRVYRLAKVMQAQAVGAYRNSAH